MAAVCSGFGGLLQSMEDTTCCNAAEWLFILTETTGDMVALLFHSQ